ncbi:MAG TPA: flagellar motor protein MotB [Verrucomicrobiae bacterium]|nr:flagellar motor protein MotB [Verrucomicrobiae bacterium]
MRSSTRRHSASTHASHERWLVSYADFITLLFAFFVVMFATSHADRAKAQQVSDSVKKALNNSDLRAVALAILGSAARTNGPAKAQTPLAAIKPATAQIIPQIAELEPSLKLLTDQLSDEIREGKVQIHMEARGLVISFRQAALFPSGQDEIARDTWPSIGKIAAAMKEIPNPVRLEGHTDSVPIHNARFRSNWELSAARSIALLDLFTDHFGVPAEKLSISGYADNDPTATNDTEEGRARNRRVDIVFLNATGMLAEPGQPAAPVPPLSAIAPKSPVDKPAPVPPAVPPGRSALP